MIKLSSQKVSKMMTLYFQGKSQTEIANKLKINQATVSLYISKFKTLVGEQGMNKAAEEFVIMESVEALHILSVELSKSHMTVEESKIGLKMDLLFQKCGIQQEEYGDLIKACKRLHDEGFIETAIKLSQLQDSTGMAYGEIVAEAASTHQELQKNQEVLQEVTGKLQTAKVDLTDIEKQRQMMKENLKKYMDQTGIDMNRLKLVEDLAMALKEAGVSNKELPDYTVRQQILHKYGIDIKAFTEILEKAQLLTWHDHGKGLLKNLSDFGGLDQARKDLKARVAQLEKQTEGLEKIAQQKGKLMADVGELQTEIATLKSLVAGLYEQKAELDKVNSELASLTVKLETLKQENNQLEAQNLNLAGAIKDKQAKVSDLAELEAKREAVQQDLTEAEAKKKREGKRWEVFEGFLGLIKASSLAELKETAINLTEMVEEAQKGTDSPEYLQNYILKELAGPQLQIMKCKSCQARFDVDKPPPVGGYKCPVTGYGEFHTVIIDKDAMDILSSAMAPKPTRVVRPIQVPKLPAPKETGNA